MPTIDLNLLRRAIADKARKALQAFRTQRPGETFYAFGLYSDDSAMTVEPAANTEEEYRRCLASAGPSSPANASMLRWATDEWGCSGTGREAAQGAQAVGELLRAKDRYDKDDPKGFVAFKGGVFAAMLLGLKDLDAEGHFGTGKARRQVTLLCSVSDSFSSVWLEEESARRLNPPSAYKAFLKEWKTYRGEDFAEHRADPGSAYRAFLAQVEAGLTPT